MQAKNVLHLIETSGPGGAEKMLVSLVKHLEQDRYQSRICLLKDGWLDGQFRQHAFPPTLMPQRQGLDLHWVRRCRGLIRQARIDLLHAHEFTMNTYGCLAALLGRIPIITTVHGKAYYGDKWRRRLAYRCVARHSFRMVAVSEDIRRLLVEKVGIRPDRVSTIYNGIDVKAYYPSERGATVRGELGIAPAAPVIGTIGSLYPVKGHTYLLRAAVRVVKEFPRAVFLIIGRGGLLDQLQEQAQQFGIGEHVRFLGFSEDIPPLLQAMDVFALPSLSEGLSLSLLEAMAAGKPVVATAVGGNPEVVLHEKTGFLVPSQDVQALASGIISLLKDQAMAHQFGVNGQRRALEIFSIEHMVNAYQELYQEALVGR